MKPIETMSVRELIAELARIEEALRDAGSYFAPAHPAKLPSSHTELHARGLQVVTELRRRPCSVRRSVGARVDPAGPVPAGAGADDVTDEILGR